MKAIICKKIKEGDTYYFKRGWKIPYEELEKMGWISVDEDEIKDTISNYFKNKYQKLPSVLLFWHTNIFLIENNFANIIEHPWKKCIYMDDLHLPSNMKRILNLIFKEFDYVFTTYAYVFLKFYPLTDPGKIVWCPHEINNKFLVDFNENPLNKILLSGAVRKHPYPFRYYLYQLKQKNKSYPLDILIPLGYDKAHHQYYAHEYIKYINKYLVGVTCASNSITPYIVGKFFEIPASGALLLAYDKYVKEPLKRLGFVDGENYLSVDYKNFEKKMKFVTDPANRTEVDRIRKNGFELVWGKHTLQDRVKLIDDTVKK